MWDTLTIAGRIRQLAGAGPDELVFRHVAMGGGESALTWPELHRRSLQLAGALSARGLAAGEILGLGLRNSPQLVLGVLAAWQLGAVPVPVRWDLPDWELDRLRGVVAPRVHLGAADIPWIDATAQDDVPDLPDVTSPNLHGICSSGSTGTPKVILTDQPGVYDPGRARPFMTMWRPVPRPQTILVLAPMYHITGFSMINYLLAGDRLVVMEKFDAARVVDVIERHRATTFIATPTMLQRIADLPSIADRDLSSIDWINQGAAPMPRSLMHRWAALIGAERIIITYGMTEAIGVTALRGDEWMAHEGSVGRGVLGTDLRILDDAGNEVVAGALGEIFMRSPFYGGYTYLGEAARLRRTADGFSTAGDLGYLDEDGYLHVIDRRVDVIVTDGATVFPAEVEAALIDHPAIADVVVVGLRDSEWGRRVHAVVEPADPANPPTAADVIAFAKSRLAPYKTPKTVEFVPTVPRSEATKVNRGALTAARGG